MVSFFLDVGDVNSYLFVNTLITLYQILKTFVNGIKIIPLKREKVGLTFCYNGNKIEESSIFYRKEENTINEVEIWI